MLYKEREEEKKERIRIYLCTLNERFSSHQTLTKQEDEQPNLIWKSFYYKTGNICIMLFLC